MKTKIENKIKVLQLEDCVKLYGNKTNPYPYIKSADLFYLGSIHEAAPVVFSESRILGTPIITTKTSSAEELVGDNGIICENNEEDIYLSFKQIFENARNKAYRTVNFVMVEAYWEIGKVIVEKQGGKETSEYGSNLLKKYLFS